MRPVPVAKTALNCLSLLSSQAKRCCKASWEAALPHLTHARSWLQPRAQGAFLVAWGVIVLVLLLFSSVTAAATAAAAWVALIRHFAQTDADRQRRITESYSKAVTQLASDKMAERLGGIYTLERISKESPDDYWTVMETLTAFVRERASWRETARRVSERAYFLWRDAGRPNGRADEHWREAVKTTEPTQPPADIAAVLTVICRREQANREREKRQGWKINLAGTDLRGAKLTGAYLENANLTGSHLEDANLMGAHLENADVVLAHLQGADLRLANLKGCQFRGSHLQGANLVAAQLQRANCADANLQDTGFIGADLEKVLFLDTHLENSDFNGANLKDTKFLPAHLEGADLRFATGLIADQLQVAFGNAETHLPHGVQRPASWPQEEPREGAGRMMRWTWFGGPQPRGDARAAL